MNALELIIFIQVRVYVCSSKGPTLSDIASLQVIACLDVRTNDEGDLVVTKGDQYDVREHAEKNEVW